MTEANVEIVRRAWDAWGRMDMDGICRDWDPAIEWDITHHEDAEPKVARGIGACMALIGEWMAIWRAYQLTVERYEPAGENVMVTFWRHALDRERGAADRRASHVWTLRDELVVRITAFSDLDEARRFAGLPAAPRA